MLQAGTLRATARLLELVDCESHKTSLDAVRLTLGLDGVVIEERRHVNISGALQVGYVIDLSPPTAEEEAERARLINPPPTIEAESRHELSGPAKTALDHAESGSATGFTPDARWSFTAVPRPPKPDASPPDGFDLALTKRERDRHKR
jgi:hypothetical protein